MKELIARWFETVVKKNWFREIDKQISRVEKAESDLFVARYTMKALVDKYNEIYGTKLDAMKLTGDKDTFE